MSTMSLNFRLSHTNLMEGMHEHQSSLLLYVKLRAQGRQFGEPIANQL